VALFAVAGAEDLLAVRFATSPLWETLSAVRTFVEGAPADYHGPWHAAVADRLERLDLAPLLATQPRHGYVPDFLTPPPSGPAPRLRDQLAALRATPPEHVRDELVRCRRDARSPLDTEQLDALAADPAHALAVLADGLHDAWRELVAPFWPRVRALLDGDIDHHSRLLARRGLRRLFDELHPRIRWTERGVEVDGVDADVVVELDERGLLLMPSAYIAPFVAPIVDEPWQPAIVYPARGVAELWRRPAVPPEALARVLGATRALLLTTLDRPLSTTALAALTELSPAGVSRHVVALRDAGLLASSRRGHEVLYRRTALGRALVAGRV
jgi:DNA-binding transcriptional ArsR family regulator